MFPFEFCVVYYPGPKDANKAEAEFAIEPDCVLAHSEADARLRIGALLPERYRLPNLPGRLQVFIRPFVNPSPLPVLP